MDKQLKDMVQFCPNTQPIYGQIYPTDQRKPAEWYIGRPGTPYQFRFFMADAHVRELLATIPLELRDDQASVEGMEARIREEVKAQYEEQVARLNEIIEKMSEDLLDDQITIPLFEDLDEGIDEDDEQNQDTILPIPNISPDKPPVPPVFRCLDTGKDFPTLEELQEHQSKLVEKQTEAPVQPKEPKKKPTSQERLDRRRGKGPK